MTICKACGQEALGRHDCAEAKWARTWGPLVEAAGALRHYATTPRCDSNMMGAIEVVCAAALHELEQESVDAARDGVEREARSEPTSSDVERMRDALEKAAHALATTRMQMDVLMAGKNTISIEKHRSIVDAAETVVSTALLSLSGERGSAAGAAPRPPSTEQAGSVRYELERARDNLQQRYLNNDDQSAGRSSRAIFSALCLLDTYEARRTPPSTAGWLPISTAPKGGKPVWVYCPTEYQTSAVYHEGRWKQDIRRTASVLPTHWRPLPPPPSQEGASEGEGQT
jgi:hypothetical protein